MILCPNDQPDPGYRCRFCQVPLHSGSSDCGCAEFRKGITHYASLCHTCATALDILGEDTPLGRVHQALVRQADMAGRPSGDD